MPILSIKKIETRNEIKRSKTITRQYKVAALKIPHDRTHLLLIQLHLPHKNQQENDDRKGKFFLEGCKGR